MEISVCAVYRRWVSDVSDGLPRRPNTAKSNFGALFDPLADKALLVSLTWRWHLGRRAALARHSGGLRDHDRHRRDCVIEVASNETTQLVNSRKPTAVTAENT